MSPCQPVCAGVLGLIACTELLVRLLVTWQVFWGVVVDDVEDVLLVLLVEELLGVWVMVRRMNGDRDHQLLPYWPAHWSARQAMAACERNGKCHNQSYEAFDCGTLSMQTKQMSIRSELDGWRSGAELQ